MMKHLLLALGLALVAVPASAQNVTCATRPTGDSTNACSSTAFVQAQLSTNIAPGSLDNLAKYTGTGSNLGPLVLGTTVYGALQNAANGAGGFAVLDSGGHVFVANIPTGIPAANSTYTQSGTGGVAQTVQANIALQPVTPQQFGAVGDGVADDTAAFNDALATVASGGKVRVPCGTYKVTTLVSVSVAAGKHIEFAGDGQDCAVINITGAINGPTFGYANQWSSVTIHDLTFTSDQTTGTNKCLVITGSFTNANSAYAATSSIYDVTFRGADAYGAATQYCAIGLNDFSISNVNIYSLTFQGIAARAGTAIELAGSGTGSTYAVAINVVGANVNNCTTGISYGDWVQGLSVTATNMTGCSNGITTAATPSGSLDQISMVNSQINTFTCGVCVNDANMNGVTLVNNLFITNINSTALKLEGTNFTVSSNQFGSTSTTGTTAIDLASATGNGGVINNNSLLGYGTGFLAGASVAALVKVNSNQFVGNTADYSINASASGIEIADTQSRNFATLPACGLPIKFSSFTIADSPTVVYNASVTVGGGANYLLIRCDGTRYYVD